MSESVRVKSCAECPLRNTDMESGASCNHPNAPTGRTEHGGYYSWENELDAVPAGARAPWCPLDAGPLTVEVDP